MDDAMSEAGIVLGVCHHDDGGSFLIQFGKEVHHFLSVLGVKVTRRFVGKDELGIGDYGTGNGYTVLLTTRELLRIVLARWLMFMRLSISFTICLRSAFLMPR